VAELQAVVQKFSAVLVYLLTVSKSGIDNALLVPPPPSRFTVEQWALQGKQRLREADDQNHLAERTLAEGSRVRSAATERSEASLGEVQNFLPHQSKSKDVVHELGY